AFLLSEQQIREWYQRLLRRDADERADGRLALPLRQLPILGPRQQLGLRTGKVQSARQLDAELCLGVLFGAQQSVDQLLAPESILGAQRRAALLARLLRRLEELALHKQVGSIPRAG